MVVVGGGGWRWQGQDVAECHSGWVVVGRGGVGCGGVGGWWGVAGGVAREEGQRKGHTNRLPMFELFRSLVLPRNNSRARPSDV